MLNQQLPATSNFEVRANIIVITKAANKLDYGTRYYALKHRRGTKTRPSNCGATRKNNRVSSKHGRLN